MIDFDSTFEAHLTNLKNAKKPYSLEEEQVLYRQLVNSIESESDIQLKEYKEATLEHYCRETHMLMTDFLDQEWQYRIEKFVERTKSVKSVDLFIQLESIIATHIDSSKYTQSSGPRFPLTIPGHYNGAESTRNVSSAYPAVRLLDSYYQLGSHKLHVGRLICEVLEQLQKRYKIDFAVLEKNSRKESL